MALTTARKKANAKYEAKAYDKTLIRLPKGRLDEIRAHIEPAGESLNGFIGRAIKETIARDGTGVPAGIPIPPPQENASQVVSAQVKAHIIKTGEDAAAFLERATESTIKRDEISLRMGINPATKAKEDLPNE